MEEKQEVKKVFDNDKYIKRTAEEIRKRIEKFPDRLYIEVGGKLFDDYHASRCIPGFRPDNKINIIKKLKDDSG